MVGAASFPLIKKRKSGCTAKGGVVAHVSRKVSSWQNFSEAICDKIKMFNTNANIFSSGQPPPTNCVFEMRN